MRDCVEENVSQILKPSTMRASVICSLLLVMLVVSVILFRSSGNDTSITRTLFDFALKKSYGMI